MYPSHWQARLWALAVLISCFSKIYAQPTTVNSAFTFLRVEPSARASGLGSAYAGLIGQDVNTFFYNPASLNAEMDRSLSLSYFNHLADLKATTLTYAHDLPKLGTLAIGVRGLSYGDFQSLSEVGLADCPDAAACAQETFSAGDLAITAGFGRTVSKHIRLGLNLHGIFSKIGQYQARALATDLGLAYHHPEVGFTATAAVVNVGRTLKSYATTELSLPTDLRLGISQKLKYMPLLVSIMFYNLNHIARPEDDAWAKMILGHTALGGEFSLGNALQIRFGFNPKRNQELSASPRLDLAGLGMGLGLKLSRFRFDYGYNNWSAAGRLHQISVQSKI